MLKLINMRSKKLIKIIKYKSPYFYKIKKRILIKDFIKSLEINVKECLKNICGRILQKRVFKNLCFIELKDFSGTIQCLLDEKTEEYRLFIETIERGDLILLKCFKSYNNRNLIISKVIKWQCLCKTILNLPDKWKGIKDIEKKYNERYLDLICNKNTFELFKKKYIFFREIRKLLNNKDFLEIPTPILTKNYGGANAKPFKTYVNSLKKNYYLSISPELDLKYLLISGFEKIYRLGPCFRNEDIDYTHNPEFNTIEIYHAYKENKDMLKYVEKIVRLCFKIFKTETLNDENKIIKWENITFDMALKKYCGETIFKTPLKKLYDTYLKDRIIEKYESMTKDKIYLKIFEKIVEPKLINPTHIHKYPICSTPLCRRTKNNKKVLQTESFIFGSQIANTYTELNDPTLQELILKEQYSEKDDEKHPINKKFIEAMKYGMPPSGGTGIGLERLIAKIINKSIKDIIFSPFNK